MFFYFCVTVGSVHRAVKGTFKVERHGQHSRAKDANMEL